MDVFDRASQLEQFHRDVAIKKIRQQANKPSRHDCFDCGEPIPQKRRDIGGIERCIHCQATFENIR